MEVLVVGSGRALSGPVGQKLVAGLGRAAAAVTFDGAEAGVPASVVQAATRVESHLV